MSAGVKRLCAKQWKQVLDVDDQCMFLNYNSDKSKVMSIKINVNSVKNAKVDWNTLGTSVELWLALVKHHRTEQHTKAEAYELSPMSREDFYKQNVLQLYLIFAQMNQSEYSLLENPDD